MKKLIYILVIAITFNSCGEYQKALKTEDIGAKFKMGTELFDAGKYSKAHRLFLQIVPKYRGKPQAEKLMYMHSKSYYEMREYYTANYQAERFVSSYPKSEKAEEIAYLGAKSFYHLSPVYSKEQKETVDAIHKLQEFINGYPGSSYIEEATKLVQELDYKLERKAFEVAKQYYTIAPTVNRGDYNSAIKAFDTFISEFPGTSFREEAMFLKFDSAYKLAVNSVAWKKEARVNEAILFYNSFKAKYSTSDRIDEANKKHVELTELQKGFNTKS